jgi:3-oxoacyl-[acyl-carrier protein] reductase
MKKVYLILGASSDLGCTLIKRLLEDETSDYKILAHYNSNNERLRKLSIQSDGRMALFRADLSSLDSTEKMIMQIINMGDCPSHIVSFSASPYRFNRLNEFDIKRIDQDMAIQVYSFAMVCKAFAPYMVEMHYGKIVVMLSSATIGIPPKNTIEYTTVKYALWGLIKSLAADYGDMGININAVSPGMIETKFIKNIGRKIKEFTAERNPNHRNLNVDDVIPIIMFLLSDDCQFMNGTNINMSGFPV